MCEKEKKYTDSSHSHTANEKLSNTSAKIVSFLPPVNSVVTSHSSDYRAYTDRPHKGLDLRAAIGTPVRAVAEGTIYKVGYEPDGFGNYVVIKHELPNGLVALTYYAHLSSYDLGKVKIGQAIGKGEYFAKSGDSGGVDPHLHFETRLLDKNTGQFFAKHLGVDGQTYGSNIKGLKASDTIDVYDDTVGKGSHVRSGVTGYVQNFFSKFNYGFNSLKSIVRSGMSSIGLTSEDYDGVDDFIDSFESPMDEEEIERKLIEEQQRNKNKDAMLVENSPIRNVGQKKGKSFKNLNEENNSGEIEGVKLSVQKANRVVVV